jgi:hypothetical protein
MFTFEFLDDPTQQEVVPLSPWHAQLWLVDAEYPFLRFGPDNNS